MKYADPEINELEAAVLSLLGEKPFEVTRHAGTATKQP